jgi:hypothetical protein
MGCRRKKMVLNIFDLKTSSDCGQFRNKITFIPQLKGHMLTPKNGTGERLACGPSLVINTIRLGKVSSKEIGKGRLRSAVHHRSAKRLFSLLKGKFSGMHGEVA